MGLDNTLFRIFKSETKAHTMIPLCGHITDDVGLTKNGDIVSVYELKGISFESKSLEQREQYKDLFNSLLHSLYSPKIIVHTHLIRREVEVDFDPKMSGGYEKIMHDEYMKASDFNPFMSNRLFITLVYRVVDYVPTFLSRNKDKAKVKEALKDAIAELNHFSMILESGLSAYKPTRLTTIKEIADNNKTVEIKYSEIAEFYSLIINHTSHKVPVGPYDLSKAIANKRILFGPESFEIRGAGDQVFG